MQCVQVQRVSILLDMVLLVADNADKTIERSFIIAEAVAQTCEVYRLISFSHVPFPTL